MSSVRHALRTTTTHGSCSAQASWSSSSASGRGGTFTEVGRKRSSGLQAAAASIHAATTATLPNRPLIPRASIVRDRAPRCKESPRLQSRERCDSGPAVPAPRPLGAVVLAAGLGKRMRSQRAKVLHELAGRPLVRHVLAALAPLDPDRVALVVGHQAEAVRAVVAEPGPPGIRDLRIVLQPEQRGTGHAVACAAAAFAGFAGDVLILYGDVPLIRPATLRALLDAHRAAGADLTLVTLRFARPAGYGKIIRGADGQVAGIIEERDASDVQRAITEVNPGLYAVRAELLFRLLAELGTDNAQGELYLTDVVGLAARAGHRVHTVAAGSAEELAGVNTRAELAHMETKLRAEIVERWMAAGVTFEDPATAYVGPRSPSA